MATHRLGIMPPCEEARTMSPGNLIPNCTTVLTPRTSLGTRVPGCQTRTGGSTQYSRVRTWVTFLPKISDYTLALTTRRRGSTSKPKQFCPIVLVPLLKEQYLIRLEQTRPRQGVPPGGCDSYHSHHAVITEVQPAGVGVVVTQSRSRNSSLHTRNRQRRSMEKIWSRHTLPRSRSPQLLSCPPLSAQALYTPIFSVRHRLSS